MNDNQRLRLLSWLLGSSLSLPAAAAGAQPQGLAAPNGALTNVTLSSGLGGLQRERTRDCKIFDGFRCEMEFMTGGAATADIDGDGWPDLYLTRIDAPDSLYRNLGNGTFVDVTAQSGLLVEGQSNGAAFADLDNDGDQDLIVTVFGAGADPINSRHRMWINDGTGSFFEDGEVRGLIDAGASTINGWSIALGDINRDGWVDFYIAQWTEDPVPSGRIFVNRGAAAPGHFVDVTERLGVDLSGVRAFAPAFVDLDDDGWQDLAITADFETSRLLWNDRGVRLIDGTTDAGVGTDENGMGSTFGDFDGDGDLDWFVTSIFDPAQTCESGGCTWRYSGNRLFRNDGQRVFTDTTDVAGVRDGAWGWGAAWIDVDNDGRLDLLQANGMQLPNVVARSFYRDPTRLWIQAQDGSFEERSLEFGLNDRRAGKGLLTFDYDRDGDVDALILSNGREPLLLRNDVDADGNWLRVRVEGRATNRDGLGAKVTVHIGEESWRREIGVDTHYLGQSERTAHFGLGDRIPDRVTVHFPLSGVTRVLQSPAVNREILIVE